MEKLYSSIRELIKDNLHKTPETAEALSLFKELDDVKSKGFMTKKQFYSVAMWKSPRPKKHYLSNSDDFIMDISRNALATDSEELRMSILTSLNGVSIAVASSLLTIANPAKYGIIDIRVWQLLHLYGEVTTCPTGQGFKLADWITYLGVLRKYSAEFNVPARDIERTFFFHHKQIQVGNLYSKAL